MKKVSILLLCVLLVAVLVIPAFAANETLITATANKTSVSKGDEITFTVNVSGKNEFTTMGVALQYDRNVFELVSVKKDRTFPATVLVDSDPASATQGFAVINDEGAYASEGQLGTFTLKVISSCPANASISFMVGVQNDVENVPVSAQGVSINVSGEHTYGAWASTGDANHARTCSVCGKTETEKHAWVDGAVTKEPTCAAEGAKNQTCACGATKSVSIPKNDEHAYDAGTVTTEPGCETKGVKTFTCVNGCGKTTTVAIDAIGHDYDAGVVTTEPGCETKGVKTFTCKNGCGKTKTEEVAAIGHDYDAGVVTTEPGCETKGVKTFTCKNGCGKTTTEEIDAKGHTPAADAEVTKKPTCEEEGIMTGKCSVCGKELSNQTIPALKHDYELSATVDPTCDTDGYKTFVCKNDAAHTYNEPIAALGHTYGDWTKADAEMHKRVCANCDKAETAAHNWNSGFVTKEATCSEEGEKLFTCTDKCGAEYTEAIPATGEHGTDEYVANEDGKTHTVTCACGEAIVEEHAYTVNGDILVKPTVSSEGQQEMLCACGAKTVKTLPKLQGELDDGVPETGDITGQVVLFAIAVVAAMTAAGYGMKRVFCK